MSMVFLVELRFLIPSGAWPGLLGKGWCRSPFSADFDHAAPVAFTSLSISRSCSPFCVNRASRSHRGT